MMKRELLSLTVLAVLICGCGYSTSSTLPSNMKRVFIENFKNEINFTTELQRNIYLPLLEVDVHNALVKRFQFDGNLRISDEPSSDIVLTGKLKSYERGGLRYTDNDDVQEYRVTITVDIQLFDKNTQTVLWHEPSFSGEGTYFVSTESEQVALNEAVEDLARRIVERTIENW